MSDNHSSKSVEQIEAEIAAARDRLAGTVDELHTRTAPQEIARRQDRRDHRQQRRGDPVALIGLGAVRRRRG